MGDGACHPDTRLSRIGPSIANGSDRGVDHGGWRHQIWEWTGSQDHSCSTAKAAVNTWWFIDGPCLEKIFHFYEKEIPYSTEVIVHDYKEEKNIDKIYAYIIVERDSQKGIIVGKNGDGIKRIGVEARKDIEAFIGKKVFLDLRVKVEENWRKNELKLKRWGYGAE